MRVAQPFGDQIPWKFGQQFQDAVFPSLSGVRIVRIAVHPSALRLGYGSTAVELLTRYYEGQMADFTGDNAEEIDEPEVKVTEAAEKVSLLEEKIMPRANIPPLLVHLRARRPEKLHYIGVSFGLTRELFRFWRKHNFIPCYIGQVPNDVTGEHSCMVLRPLNNDETESDESGQYGFLTPFYQDFRERFRRLLGTAFQTIDYKLAMSILASKIDFAEHDNMDEGSKSLLNLLSPYDMKRLEAYTNSCVDFPMKEMKLEGEQVMSSFRKVMKKLYNYLYSVTTKEIEATLPRLKEVTMAPHSVSVDEELYEAAREVMEKMKAENEGVPDPEYLQQYAIGDREGNFEKALQNRVKISASGLISVKSSRSESDKHEKKGKGDKETSKSKRKGTGDDRSRSNKKKKSEK